MTKNEVLSLIRTDLAQYGGFIKFYSTPMAYRSGQPYSSGYFQYPEMSSNGPIKAPSLHIGTGFYKDMWFYLLLHEYNHFRQWVENKNLFTKWDFRISLYDFRAKVEWDCEKRTLQFIKWANIEHLIDLTHYARRANAYVLFYQVVKETKRWYDKAPQASDKLLESMPNTLIRKPNQRISKKLQELYHKECYSTEKGNINGSI